MTQVDATQAPTPRIFEGKASSVEHQRPGTETKPFDAIPW